MVLSSVGFSFFKDVVELYDSADEIAKFHEVSRDDVDAALPRLLGADPLHHGRESSEKGGKRWVTEGEALLSEPTLPRLPFGFLTY